MNLPERELFSLYALYPDITFDFPANTDLQHIGHRVAAEFSSPASTSEEGQHDEGNASFASGSTAYTSPLRPDQTIMTNTVVDEFQQYLALLRVTDLPDDVKRYYRSLGGQITRIGNVLFVDEANAVVPETVHELLRLSKILLSQLQYSIKAYNDQIASIDWLKSHAHFVVVPSNEALWSTYRQRADLIVE